ncbi:PIF-like transposase [Gossypium australe]|uniref:PIF-like transposase n=1 Tax=Gossypium australe TaxID=47621 RepID=A0A5B6VJY2_9ROSI|nr:PIF-like transposase [Gossypium australe]
MLMEKLDAMVQVVTEKSIKDMELINLEAHTLVDSLAKLLIHNVPCMTSFQTGEKWMQELLNGHEKCCFNMFRMTQSTFHQLCTDLESNYRLLPSDRISTLENVNLFVFNLSKGASNRDVQKLFQNFGETLSTIFKRVLDAMNGLLRDIIRARDPKFKETISQIIKDTKYMPQFKDRIGAINGTYIDAIIHEENQLRYKGRKGTPTINVLAACNFDLLFTYVLSGWKGSAHDSCIFLDTIGNPSLNFPKPLPGKYYLVKKGYPERQGYLTPYHKIRYHPSESRGANSRGP